MAGTYPDPPGPRIAYDRDGTAIFVLDPTLTTATAQANSVNQALNDEDTSGTSYLRLNQSQYALFLFPQPMNLTHWAIWNQTTINHQSGINRFEIPAAVSTNSTNGIDGTWTAITTPEPLNTNKATMRTNITSISANGVVALRFQRDTYSGTNSGFDFYAIHLYGKPAATSDRLEFWHPTLDQPLSDTPAYFDYGDVARGSGAITKDFRIKNLSTSLTANTITVGCEARTDASPTYVSQTEFRYNGGSFAATTSLNTLAPSTISQTFSVRLTTTGSSALSLWSQRYYASAASWS